MNCIDIENFFFPSIPVVVQLADVEADLIHIRGGGRGRRRNICPYGLLAITTTSTCT